MSIADRIQDLRKSRGVSQEELADAAGVSRQAVSKWESGQSVPDVDKIILLSDFFGVPTDYILKGIEGQKPAAERAVDANVFVIVATVLNFIGLLVASAVWYERQVSVALVIGLSIMAVGCVVFAIGMLSGAQSTKEKAKRNFYVVNCWLLCFIPLSFIYNILFTGQSAPYPLPVRPLLAFAVFWLVYIGVCLAVVFVQIKRNRTGL